MAFNLFLAKNHSVSFAGLAYSLVSAELHTIQSSQTLLGQSIDLLPRSLRMLSEFQGGVWMRLWWTSDGIPSNEPAEPTEMDRPDTDARPVRFGTNRQPGKDQAYGHLGSRETWDPGAWGARLLGEDTKPGARKRRKAGKRVAGDAGRTLTLSQSPIGKRYLSLLSDAFQKIQSLEAGRHVPTLKVAVNKRNTNTATINMR